MFEVLNNGYQSLLPSTVEINMCAVQIIPFCLLSSLQNSHVVIYMFSKKKTLLRIYDMNICNTYVFEYLLCAGSCSGCFTIKYHGRHENRVLRAYKSDEQASREGDRFWK